MNKRQRKKWAKKWCSQCHYLTLAPGETMNLQALVAKIRRGLNDMGVMITIREDE